MSDVNAYLFVSGGSSIAFVMIFCISWGLSARYVQPHFQQFTLSQKADWCSRINSTVHALVIVPGFIASVISTKWNTTNFSSGDEYGIFVIRCLMSVSTAYFFVDLLVVILYRVPLWIVFVIHHIVAFIPLAVNVFDAHCPWGTFILALFLLVEVPTITLNVQAFLEQTGHANSRAYAVFFYLTYILWICFRLVLPVVLLYCLWHNVVPSIGNFACAGFGIAASHLITLFCFTVFIFVLTKELKERWSNASGVLDVAVISPGRGSVTGLEETIHLAVESPSEPDNVIIKAEQVTSEKIERNPTSKIEHEEVQSSSISLEHVPNEERDYILEFPHVSSIRITHEDIQWGLGIERPDSVMRHGGAIIR